MGYYSKLLNEKDARMSQVELEGLAAVLACVNFRSWIWGRHCTLYTDAQAIQWMLSQKSPNGKVMRWAMRLMEFDLTVIHRRGEHNGNADALSRLPRIVN